MLPAGPSRRKPAAGPALYRGNFQASTPADTFLDLRGWGKGVVFVNGRNAGRYWKIGPQQTLFVPASWMRRGANEVIVLDLLEGGARSVQGRVDPVYETVVLEATVEMAAPQSDDGVGSPHSAEHAGLFEPGTDYSFAASLDYAGTDK